MRLDGACHGAVYAMGQARIPKITLSCRSENIMFFRQTIEPHTFFLSGSYTGSCWACAVCNVTVPLNLYDKQEYGGNDEEITRSARARNGINSMIAIMMVCFELSNSHVVSL